MVQIGAAQNSLSIPPTQTRTNINLTFQKGINITALIRSCEEIINIPKSIIIKNDLL
jgi:hypothetical protein